LTKLNLIRIPVNLKYLAKWAGERGKAVGFDSSVYDKGKVLHHLLTETFGTEAFKCFRLMVADRAIKGNLYAYSSLGVKDLQANSAIYGMPEHLTVLGIDAIEGKTMPENWRKDQLLGFDLRIRPVRRIMKELNLGKEKVKSGAELDAFLIEAKRTLPNSSSIMNEKGRTRQAVYLDWLIERTSDVAEIDRNNTKLNSFIRSKILRGKKTIDGPDAIFHGNLKIKDPLKFTHLLEKGIGRHRAFGYGMILLRPPNSPVPKF